MESVILSIQPKWCELIASGKKTIEVRKTRPQIETPFKCYIYCTKDTKKHYYIDEYGDRQVELIPTKIIGEFVCDRVYKIENKGNGFYIDNNIALTNRVARGSCLQFNDLRNYFGNKDGYGWHISDLKIYDKPKELGEFKREGFMTEEQWLYSLYPNTHCHYEAWAKRFELTRPPQSWMFCEVLVE